MSTPAVVLAELDSGTAAVVVALISTIVGPPVSAWAATRKLRGAVGTPNGRGDVVTMLERIDARVERVDSRVERLDLHVDRAEKRLDELEAGCPLFNPPTEGHDDAEEHDA